MIRLTDQPIDTQVLLTDVSDPHCGAVVLFVGTTRKWTRRTHDKLADAHGTEEDASDQNASDQNAGDQNAGDQNAGDQNAGVEHLADELIETDHLLYDAYQEMAIKQMHELEEAAKKRWPVERVSMVHRLGRVNPTEPSVGVAVSCPHRSEAFEAARWLIDELKHQVPIWKQEHYVQRGPEWIHPSAGSCSCTSKAHDGSATSEEFPPPASQTPADASGKLVTTATRSAASANLTEQSPS